MKEISLTKEVQTDEEKWSYIRPGFYAVKKRSIIPAMVCLGEAPFSKQQNIDFVLVKPDCYLNEWEDALLVSEKDYNQAIANCTNDETPTKKFETLAGVLAAKGYLPLTKLVDKNSFLGYSLH